MGYEGYDPTCKICLTWDHWKEVCERKKFGVLSDAITVALIIRCVVCLTVCRLSSVYNARIYCG